MTNRILVTGSEGLIGSALRATLESRQFDVVGLDINGIGVELGDVRNMESIRSSIRGCIGVVHLAAVSRVVWAEQDPKNCWNTNVGGLINVVQAIEEAEQPPWLIFASSREVYGKPDLLPVTEDSPIRPINVYGRSKAEGERITHAAHLRGTQTAIVRFSNVYGNVHDHPDRVVPAFARSAVLGQPLRVDGLNNTFDFTHVDDTVQGISTLIQSMTKFTNSIFPPIHFLTGQQVTLGDLASLTIELAGSGSSIQTALPRKYDVGNFYGDWTRALNLLNWKPEINIRHGLSNLIRNFQLKMSVENTCGN